MRNVKCVYTDTRTYTHKRTIRVYVGLFHLYICLLHCFLIAWATAIKSWYNAFINSQLEWHFALWFFFFLSVCQTAQNKSIPTLIIWHLVLYLLLSCNRYIFFLSPHYHYFFLLLLSGWVHHSRYNLFSNFLHRLIEASMGR